MTMALTSCDCTAHVGLYYHHTRTICLLNGQTSRILLSLPIHFQKMYVYDRSAEGLHHLLTPLSPLTRHTTLQRRWRLPTMALSEG